jgi:hypothetical protein
VEEYLKQLPPPPEEHTHELKMEKRLKRLIEKQKEDEMNTVNHHEPSEPKQLPQSL